MDKKLLFAMVFFVLMVGIVVMPSKKELGFVPKTTPTAIPTIIMTDNTNDIRTILRNILSQKVIYDSSNSVPTFYQEIKLSDIFPKNQDDLLFINSMKYTQGAKYKSGYEGGEWDVELDKWVSFLKTPSISSFYNAGLIGLGKDGLSSFTSKVGNKYVVYNSSFPPSASVVRVYSRFDEASQQIIDIQIWLYVGNGSNNQIQQKYLYAEIEKMLP